jgi:hypothetical protein
MSRQQSSGGRRAPLPPSPLRAEPLRTGLVDALAVRFDVPVMAVVEGAGYDKTTALAQAIRANDTAPRGIDAWWSTPCRVRRHLQTGRRRATTPPRHL